MDISQHIGYVGNTSTVGNAGSSSGNTRNDTIVDTFGQGDAIKDATSKAPKQEDIDLDKEEQDFIAVTLSDEEGNDELIHHVS
ncbi:hypothetical protein Tco_0215777 [Tanacetum coccineum]